MGGLALIRNICLHWHCYLHVFVLTIFCTVNCVANSDFEKEFWALNNIYTTLPLPDASVPSGCLREVYSKERQTTVGTGRSVLLRRPLEDVEFEDGRDPEVYPPNEITEL